MSNKRIMLESNMGVILRQLNLDNSSLQGKSEKVQVSGNSNYREFGIDDLKLGNTVNGYCTVLQIHAL